jgi:hypothetical protein
VSADEHLNPDQFGELPAPPGEAAIPEGHDRYYHQTNPDNVESIRKHGLLYDKGLGIEGPKGTWISSKPFYGDSPHAATVEMHLPHDPQRGSIASIGDVHPSSFVAIHEPWHAKARYMEKSPQVRQAVLAGEHDSLLGTPDYGPAIRHIKAKYGKRP